MLHVEGGVHQRRLIKEINERRLTLAQANQRAAEMNGVVTSLTATDPLWTLTGGNLAAGFVRKYLLLWDATTATTVATVLQSLSDQPIVTTAAAALALCRFPGSPPVNALGIAPAVVGVLSITNLTNPFIPGTTLLGATGVTAAYRDGPDVHSFIASITTP